MKSSRRLAPLSLEGPVRIRRSPSKLCLTAICISFMGCALSVMKPLELPDQPIAFVHWSGKDAKKRSGAFESVAELPPTPRGLFAPDRQHEEEIRAHLQAEMNLSLHERLATTPGRLMLLWPKTGEVTPVESAPLGSRPLAWSSDHKRLLFASAHRGRKEQLYEVHIERKDLRRLTVGPAEHPRGDYETQGDEDRLLVQRLVRRSKTGVSRSTLHLAKPGGRLGRAIARDIPPGTIRVVPGGARLIYEQVRSRQRQGRPAQLESMIGSRKLGPGGEEVLLVRGREPTLTPDGEWIVFASPSSAGYRLRRMRLDGTSRVAISPGGSEERMPSVSPDGQFVVFVQMTNGYRRLAVRSFDGKSEQRLLKDGWSEFPVW